MARSSASAVDREGLERDLQLVDLAVVADVRDVGDHDVPFRDALTPEGGDRGVLQGAEPLVERVEVRVARA